MTFLEGIPNLATALVALSYAVAEHWTVGAAMVGVVCLGGGVTALQITSQQGVRVRLNETKAAMGGSVVELLSNLPYLRASGMRRLEEARLEASAEGLRRTEFRHHKAMMGFGGAKDLIEQVIKKKLLNTWGGGCTLLPLTSGSKECWPCKASGGLCSEGEVTCTARQATPRDHVLASHGAGDGRRASWWWWAQRCPWR